MKQNQWNNYPFVSACVVAGAAAMLLFAGFYRLDGIPDSPQRLAELKRSAILGHLVWIVGCGMVSRTRFSTWKHGLLLGLFSVPGLLFLLLRTGGKNRQEVWEEANPGLVGRQMRRHYRNVRPLY